MKLKYLFTAIILFIGVAAVAKDDQTVLIKTEDQEMNAAINKAQATLNDFLKIKSNPPAGASGFKLKVKLTDQFGTEHMWVTPFKQTDNGFTGTLSDEPEYIKSVKNGQQLDFTRADISDWGYVQDGKQKGSFTVCVVFKHIPASEAERYRRDYGFEC